MRVSQGQSCWGINVIYALRPSLTEGFWKLKRFVFGPQTQSTVIEPKMVIFQPFFFGYIFRDGPQPEIEPHFRTTPASEPGVWIWVPTQRGRHKRSHEPKTTAPQHKSDLPSTLLLCPVTPRAILRHHEPMELDSDRVDYESLASVAVAIEAFTKINHNLSHGGQGQSTSGRIYKESR